jgi:chromosomal replication initiator protein
MLPTHDELWRKCLSLIHKSVGDELFSTWFADARSVSYKDNSVVISLPSDYFRTLYEDRFSDAIERAMIAVYGPEVRLYYQIGLIDETVIKETSKIKTPPKDNNQSKDRVVHYQNIQSQLNDSYTFDNYCVGKCNELPYTVAKYIADNPDKVDFNPFFIYGSVGVGKTHLIQAIGARIKELRPEARVLYITLRNFQNQLGIAVVNKTVPEFTSFYQSIDVLLIDDIQELAGKTGTMDSLFNIFNHLHNNGKKLIFTCDRPPYSLEGLTDRLIDRFKWGLTEQLQKPDFALRKKILTLKVEANGLNLPQDVIDVIAENVDDSVRELEGIVNGIISRAIMLSVPITKELAIAVMRQSLKPRRKSINFEMIVDTTAEFFKINPDVIYSKSRVRDISDARQIIMYLAHKHLTLSSPSIGRMLGRTHATVLHGITAVQNRIPREKNIGDAVDWIESELKK